MWIWLDLWIHIWIRYLTSRNPKWKNDFTIQELWEERFKRWLVMTAVLISHPKDATSNLFHQKTTALFKTFLLSLLRSRMPTKYIVTKCETAKGLKHHTQMILCFWHHRNPISKSCGWNRQGLPKSAKSDQTTSLFSFSWAKHYIILHLLLFHYSKESF